MRIKGFPVSRILAVAIAADVVLRSMAALAQPAPPAPADFDERVRAYLLSHPEIIQEMLQTLRARQTAATIAPVRSELQTPYAGAWMGNAKGEVVLVEFMDYACPHCRAMGPVIEQLIAQDSRVKVVFRQLPILGKDSEIAAMQSLAAAEQGRFAPYHLALLKTTDAPSADVRAKAMAAAGIAAPISPTPARSREIDRNIELARLLRLEGTPAFVIGDLVLSGEPTLQALQDAVKQARTASRATR